MFFLINVSYRWNGIYFLVYLIFKVRVLTGISEHSATRSFVIAE